MDWETSLITLYLTVCKEYSESLRYVCARFTNGGIKRFSDEEVMTIYLFGLMRGLTNVKKIHQQSKMFLSQWFPHLPGYAAYIHRLNRLGDAFRELIGIIQTEQLKQPVQGDYLIDSFPVVLAQHNHAYSAKVALELASKSYNSTKKMFYHGVKLHVLARRRAGSLPDIERVVIEAAGRQDARLFDYQYL